MDHGYYAVLLFARAVLPSKSLGTLFILITYIDRTLFNEIEIAGVVTPN